MNSMTVAKQLLFIAFISISTIHAQQEMKGKAIAEWTVLVYIQANNSLGPFAEININDMIRGMYSDATPVNIVVQWEKPNATKTERYKITKRGLVKLATLNYAMGAQPAKSLIDCTQWIKTDFPAKHYCIILWNHGSGVNRCRGILYDDYYGTFLSNSDLTLALTAMARILGHPIDILGMDACLMNMVEVAYQARNLALYMVGSEQTEPGNGWAYSRFISPLTANPAAFDAKKLSKTIVSAIGSYYQGQYDFTASAFDMHYLDQLKNAIDAVVAKVNVCKKYNATQIKNAVIAARKKALAFYVDDYIDLYTFFHKLNLQISTIRRQTNVANAYTKTLDDLLATLNKAMQLITTAIVANVDGTRDASAKGISIYYLNTSKPARLIPNTYLAALFARESSWLKFIQENR